MPCVRMPNTDKTLPDGFICGFHPTYEFDGYLFEVHPYHGPCPMTRKDPSEPRKTIPAGFWDMWEVFKTLPEGAKRALLYKEA